MLFTGLSDLGTKKKMEPPRTARTDRALCCSLFPGIPCPRHSSWELNGAFVVNPAEHQHHVQPALIRGPHGYSKDVIIMNNNNYEVSSTEDT